MPSMGEILAHLGLNDSKFKAGVNNVGQWSKGKFAAIGATAAGAFAASFAIGTIQKTIETTARIKELSEQSGFTTEEFQKLAYQVRQAGGSMDDVVRAGNTLDRMLAKLAEGNKQAAKDFKTMGIEMEDLFSLSRLEIINRIQESFMSLNKGERGGFLDAMRRLFGDDSAKRFLAAFQEGWKEGLEKAYIISDDTLDNIKKITGAFQDSDDELNKGMADTISRMSGDVIKMNKAFNETKMILAAFGGYSMLGIQEIGTFLGDLTADIGTGMQFQELKYKAQEGLKIKQGKAELQKIKAEMEKLFPSELDENKQNKNASEIKNVLNQLNPAGPLRKIGGFMVGQEAEILKTSQRQLIVLQQINSNVKQLKNADAAIMG